MEVFSHPNPRWFINERQLQPHYVNALRYLSEKYGPENVGDYYEFGVSRGSSMLLMYQETVKAGLDHVRLFGFDSFEGLPADNEGWWTEGDFCANIDDVRKRFANNKVDLSRINLVKGFYSDSLTDQLKTDLNMGKAGIIMIDCDMYSSTAEALEFCEPLIQDEVIMIFDDWNPLAQQNMGEKRAFDEFLAKYRHFKAEEIGTYHYHPGDLHGKVFNITRQA
ncbi:TylF/MycF/NovP-related O-methyltransferase [Pontiella sp.]|uniref:TylF/MycF/NovP-related O-methyltransferase n=1 Tax=Pontiella sp. TaxID=2837462 RepID=UPI003566AAC9